MTTAASGLALADVSRDAAAATEEILFSVTTLGRRRDEDGESQSSNQLRDQVWGEKVLSPPYDPEELSKIPEVSSILPQCIEARARNIEGYGHHFAPRFDPKAFSDQELEERAIERRRAERFFDLATLDYSFGELRDRTRRDIDSVGWSGWEYLRDIRTGDLCGLEHVPGLYLRLSKQSEVPVPIRRWVLTEDESQWEEQHVLQYPRLYVQAQGSRKVWFKMPGDPRAIDKETGEVLAAKQGDAFDASLAHELLFHTSYNPRSPYGLPPWVGTLISVAGARAAEEVNWLYFTNKSIPPMIMTVAGGQIPKAEKERLAEQMNELKGVKNWHKIMIIEAVMASSGSPSDLLDPGRAIVPKIEIKQLVDAQQGDALFQRYDAECRSKARSACGIPPLFTSECHSWDTEYLTDAGWLTIESVGASHRLATLNTTTREIEYQEWSKRHTSPYKGKMIHLRNKGVDALVTPNHRMWVRPTVAKGRTEKAWGFVLAEDITALTSGCAGLVEIPTSAAWCDDTEEVWQLPLNVRKNAWDPSKPTNNLPLAMHLLHHKDQVHEVDYDGRVGCFTVPNQTLVTRRNGRVLISGNSQEYTRATASAALEVAERSTFAPARAVVDDRVNRFLLPEIGVKWWRFASNGPNLFSAEDVAAAISSGVQAGVGSPNTYAKVLSRIFGVEVPQVDAPWANLPHTLVQAAVASGLLTVDADGSTVNVNQEAVDRFRSMVDGALDDTIERVLTRALGMQSPAA